MVNIELQYDPVILLPNINPRVMKTCHTKTSIQMLVAALFIIAQKWEQSECPSIDKRINIKCVVSLQWNIIS